MIKRFFTAMAVALPMAFIASCEKPQDEQVEPVIATYYLTADETEVIELADQRSKDVRLNVKAVETVGSEANLTFALKADASLIEAYNEANATDCIALPGDCYSFATKEVTISRYGVNSTTALLTVTANNLEIGKNYLLPVTIAEVKGGDYRLTEAPECYIKVCASLGGSVQVDLTGLRDDACLPADATKTPDLVIKTADDMMKIPEILVNGQTKYVVLDADIDMAGKSWTPINTGEGYSKGLEFNGQGHTIRNFTCTSGSYRSFYGIMNGRMYDVTFEDAVIDGTADGGSQPCAVIAGYGGNKQGMCEAIIYDVHVSGTIKAKAAGVGGLVGVAVNTIVKRSSADVAIDNTNGRRAGGLVGYHNCTHDGAFLRIEDSWSAGSIFGTQNIGGIIGQTQFENGKNANSVAASLIRNCYSTMTVTALRNAGGIASGCSYGGSYATTELEIPKDIVMNCVAWNDKIEAKETSKGNYSSGAIIGYCNIYQYFIDCFRKPDLDFSCPIAELGIEVTLLDQDNTSPELSLFTGTKADAACPYAYDHAYPYHGKAAGEGVTVSALAKALGWDESVWDLSEALPVLK